MVDDPPIFLLAPPQRGMKHQELLADGDLGIRLENYLGMV